MVLLPEPRCPLPSLRLRCRMPDECAWTVVVGVVDPFCAPGPSQPGRAMGRCASPTARPRTQRAGQLEAEEQAAGNCALVYRCCGYARHASRSGAGTRGCRRTGSSAGCGFSQGRLHVQGRGRVDVVAHASDPGAAARWRCDRHR